MKKIILFCFLCISLTGISQQMQQSSLYMYNALYYNPAYAGSREVLSATLVAREQWVGIKGAPSSQYFSVHSPLKFKSIAVGGYANFDRTGARQKFSAYGVATGSIRLNSKGHRLNVGINFGVDNFTNKFSELYAIDANDNLIASASTMKFNIGSGIYYYGERHYIGFSVPAFLNQKDVLFSNLIKPHYFLTAGYVFRLNSTLDMKVSALAKYIPGAPLTADLNLSFLMYKKMWLGAMFRTGESVGVNFAYTIGKQFTLGYAFDFPINKLARHQYGSHEVMLMFDLKRSQDKIYSPRYF